MTEATEPTEKKVKYTRVPSAIQFPYTDMSDAIAVADGLLKGGGVPMSRDQLAAAMALAPGGGGFAKKLSTAGMFGVLDVTAGKYQLTELGFEIVDSGREQDAKAKAFLNVELYKRTYEEFRGKLLPTRPHGLEAAFISFGVSPKNVKDARRAFEKSARMAGFFPSSTEDRLVLPFGAGTTVHNLSTADVDTGSPEIGRPKLSTAPPAPTPSKALEYELVDLLKLDGIGEAESEAIWTLVRFLTARKKDG